MQEPEELTLLKEFANSLDVEEGTDDLGSPAALTAWLAARRLVEATDEASDDELAVARRLRSGLRRALAAHHDAGHDADHDEASAGPGPGELDELDAVASALPLRVAFEGGGPRLVGVPGGVRGALARLLADVALAQCRGTWDRLKICPADDCAWVFYDQSKNRSRRWCSMGVCGNRTKVRAYRDRHRA